MPGSTSQGYTASASSTSQAAYLPGSVNANPWQAFDNSITTFWENFYGATYGYSTTGTYVGTASSGGAFYTTAGIYNGEWLQIQFPTATFLQSYSLQGRSGQESSKSPNTFVILWSNDGANWTLLDSRSGVAAASYASQAVVYFTISNRPTAYTYFRMVVQNVQNTGAIQTVNIAAWTLNPLLDFYADTLGNLTTATDGAGLQLASWLGGATGYVATWYDQSRNSYDLSQPTPANQPAINLGTSPYSLIFNGSTSWIYNSSVPFNLGAGSFTLRYVVSNSTGGCVLFKAIGTAFTWNAYEKKFWLGNGTTSETSVGVYPSQVGNSENYVLSSTQITPSIKTSIVHKATSTTAVPIYVNGTAATLSTNSINMQTDAGNYLIVGRGGNATSYNGNMFDIELFSTPLSDADRNILDLDQGISSTAPTSAVDASVLTTTVGGISVNFVTVDSSSSVYICGTYTGNPVIYNISGSGTSSSSGYSLPNVGANARPFMIKFSAAGAYQFSTALINSLTLHESSVMTVDTLGNIYWAGEYNNTPTVYNATANPCTSSTGYALPTLTDNSRRRSFILKYNASTGAYISGACFPQNNGFYDNFVRFLKCDSANNLFVGFSYYGSPTIYQFTTNPATLTSSGVNILNNPSGFVYAAFIKYNSSGNYVAYSPIPPSGATYPLVGAGSIDIDSSDSIYVTGGYRATPTIYNFASSPTSTGITLPNNPSAGGAGFFIKWNSSGNYVFSTAWRNSGGGGGINNVKVDSSGNIYLIGFTYNSVTIYNLTSTPNTSSAGITPSQPNASPLIIKYNSSGTYLSCLYVTQSINGQQFAGFGFDTSGNVYISGNYQVAGNIQNFSSTLGGSSTGIAYPASANQSAQLLKYNSSGTYQSGTMLSYNLSTFNSYLYQIAVSGTTMYATGYYNGAAIPLYSFTSTPNTTFTGASLPSSGTQQAGVLLKFSNP